MKTARFAFAHTVLTVLGIYLIYICTGTLVSCKGDNDTVEQTDTIYALDRVTEEELAKFNPDIPLSKGHGQSRAFKSHPLDEMRISAPAGAFDADPDIHVSVASDELLEAVEKKVERELQGERLLWAYDIDAGLPSDSVLPGKYKVEINLKRLGVPKELYSAIRLWRMDDKGKLQPLNTRLKNGVICYHACQNSVLVTTICSIALIYVAYKGIQSGSIGLPLKVRMDYEGWANAGFPLCFWKKSDLVQVPVEDSFGNFIVLFLHSKTEDKDHSKEYIEKASQLSDRLDALDKKATKKYDKENSKLKYMWLGRAEAEKMRRIGIYEEYVNLLKADTITRKLLRDPALQLPQSVRDIVKGTMLANRFSQDKEGLGLKPLSYDYWVYIVPSQEIGSSTTKALFQPYPVVGGTIYVNYDGYLKQEGGKTVYDRKKTDAMCVNMAHEIGHAYEHEYVTTIFLTDKRFLEAIGSITEHWFAAWMKKKGYFTYADTESAETAELLEYAERDNKQLLSWPLELKYPDGLLGVADQNTYGGYMLADLIQYLCDHKKKVSFDDIMNGYAYNKSFLQDMKDIFGIPNDRDFYNLYEKFCWKYMAEIVKAQEPLMLKSNANYLVPIQVHSSATPIRRLRNLGHNGKNNAYPFAVKAVKLKAKEKPLRPYHLFAVPSPSVKVQDLKFSFLEGDSMKQTKNRLLLEPDPKNVPEFTYGVLLYRPDVKQKTIDSDYYIDIVTLYQPEHNPEVKGPKEGQGLMVDLKEQPNTKLVTFHYVSGMQLIVNNNKNKKKYCIDYPIEKCGKVVPLPYHFAKLDSTDIDISISTRWFYSQPQGDTYYSPETPKVDYKKVMPKEKPKKEEPVVNNQPEEEPSKPGLTSFDGNVVLTYCLFDQIKDYYKKNHVTGHLSVKGEQFELSIPAHSGTCTYSSDKIVHFSVSSFIAHGKCTIYPADKWHHVFSVKFDPQEYYFGPITIKWTRDDLNHYNYKHYEMTTKGNRPNQVFAGSPDGLNIWEDGQSSWGISVLDGFRKEWDEGQNPPSEFSGNGSYIKGYVEGYQPAKGL